MPDLGVIVLLIIGLVAIVLLRGRSWGLRGEADSENCATRRTVEGTMTDNNTYPVSRTEQEWREQLAPEEFAVLRQAGTERPFVGEYTDTTTEGVYSCRACGFELFRSETKFESHCGWPSFYAPLAQDSVEYLEDSSLGRTRTEVRCANCGSHLGHVFEGEGYDTPTDQRYCMNSIAMTLTPTAAATKPAAAADLGPRSTSVGGTF